MGAVCQLRRSAAKAGHRLSTINLGTQSCHEFGQRIRATVLRSTSLATFFEAVVTGDEIVLGKPHPDIYLRVAEKLGVASNGCFVIEDLLSGVAASKGVGMRVATIPDRRFVDSQEYEKETDYLLSDLSGFAAIIRAGFLSK